VIVGGGIITSEPELMSHALNVDYAVIGEGEQTIIELLQTIETGGDISLVNGIGYFRNGRFVLTEARKPINDLDSLPWPDYDGFSYNEHLATLKPTDMYFYEIFDHPREYPIITSRSCPFQCTFCYHSIGKKYRQRSIDSVMQELAIVIPKYHINIVSVYDDLFSHNDRRILEFCSRFKEIAHTVPWEVKWFCQLRVKDVKKSLLDTMHESGCFMISYGFESYSPTILKSMRKGITPEQIHNAIHVTLDSRISIQANFIFGDRAETLQTARETLDFWKEHLEAGIQLFFIFACPNSALYQYCVEKGIIKDKVDFLANHLFDIVNMTDMSDADFLELRAMISAYVVRNTVYSVPLKRNASSVTVRCPHCCEIIEYRNYTTKSPFYYAAPVYCRSCRKRIHIASRMFSVVHNLKRKLATPSAYALFYKYLAKNPGAWRKDQGCEN
jgi:radical SAM superfamily enzyme YgiQ (UPF0313 family)